MPTEDIHQFLWESYLYALKKINQVQRVDWKWHVCRFVYPYWRVKPRVCGGGRGVGFLSWPLMSVGHQRCISQDVRSYWWLKLILDTWQPWHIFAIQKNAIYWMRFIGSDDDFGQFKFPGVAVNHDLRGTVTAGFFCLV